MKTFEERFWLNVERAEGCWPWRGTQKGDGYGTIKIGQKKVGAHRAMWELTNGPIPLGLHVLHTCDNPGCVNPDHLWLGTHAENMRDMSRKGRAGGRFGLRSHCLHGHPLTLDNRRKDGRCKTCQRKRERESYQRTKRADLVGRVYLERGARVVVVARWATGGGPRNVLVRREDGALVVRPFRGLRKVPT